MAEQECYYIQDPDSLQGKTDRMSRILDAKYSKTDLYKIACDMDTLTSEEQDKLRHLLRASESLFDGTLGRWVGDPYKIKLRDGAEPFHAKPFPVPHAYERTLQMEVNRLCQIGVLKKVNRSEYASPSFIIPKKDDTVRFINDFRELNKRVKRTPYPIPKIQDMLLKL